MASADKSLGGGDLGKGREYVPAKPLRPDPFTPEEGGTTPRLEEEGRTLIPPKAPPPGKPEKESIEKGRVYIPPKTPPKQDTPAPPSKPRKDG